MSGRSGRNKSCDQNCVTSTSSPVLVMLCAQPVGMSTAEGASPFTSKVTTVFVNILRSAISA